MNPGKILAIAALLAGVLLSTRALAQDHAAIVEAAKKEGKLSVASSAPGEAFTKFMQAFKDKYPFLDVASGFYAAPTGRVLTRVSAEIEAHNISFDVMLAANLAAFVDLARKNQLQRYDSPEYAAFQHSGIRSLEFT